MVLAGCDDASKEQAPASVGGQKITKTHLEQTVEHFQEEAKKEGKPFPKDGTPAFKRTERRLLELLVYRKELEIAAGRLGIHVDNDQIEEQLRRSGGEEDKGAADETFLRDTAQTQLITEAVARRLSARIKVTPAEVRAYYRAHRSAYGKTSFADLRASIRAQLLAERRNSATTRWIAEARRSLEATVRYEVKG